MKKYSYYEFEILEQETGEREYETGVHGRCLGYKFKYVYKIYGEGCQTYYDGVIESDEWFYTEQEADTAAMRHIDLLENGECSNEI